MTGAERQKRYRDKKRGGPPVGRWGGHLSHATFAKLAHVGRTFYWMLGWMLLHHASEV